MLSVNRLLISLVRKHLSGAINVKAKCKCAYVLQVRCLTECWETILSVSQCRSANSTGHPFCVLLLDTHGPTSHLSSLPKSTSMREKLKRKLK